MVTVLPMHYLYVPLVYLKCTFLNGAVEVPTFKSTAKVFVMYFWNTAEVQRKYCEYTSEVVEVQYFTKFTTYCLWRISTGNWNIAMTLVLLVMRPASKQRSFTHVCCAVFFPGSAICYIH